MSHHDICGSGMCSICFLIIHNITYCESNRKCLIYGKTTANRNAVDQHDTYITTNKNKRFLNS